MPEANNNTELLRKWFRGCPILNRDKRFGVDYLSDVPTEYAIYASPSTINYRENVLGEEIPLDIQTLNFIFAAKENYGADVRQNLANIGFFDAVTAWVIEQNSLRNFPAIQGGKVKSIVPTLTVFPAEIGSDAAKYQIQLKMTYRRE